MLLLLGYVYVLDALVILLKRWSALAGGRSKADKSGLNKLGVVASANSTI